MLLRKKEKSHVLAFTYPNSPFCLIMQGKPVEDCLGFQAMLLDLSGTLQCFQRETFEALCELKDTNYE